MINKDIYDKAFDLRERLNRLFISGYNIDLAICYALTEAIENLKKEMEDNMAAKKKASKKVAAKKTAKKMK